MNELAAGRRIRRIDVQKYTFFNTTKILFTLFLIFFCILPRK